MIINCMFNTTCRSCGGQSALCSSCSGLRKYFPTSCNLHISQVRRRDFVRVSYFLFSFVCQVPQRCSLLCDTRQCGFRGCSDVDGNGGGVGSRQLYTPMWINQVDEDEESESDSESEEDVSLSLASLLWLLGPSSPGSAWLMCAIPSSTVSTDFDWFEVPAS